MFGVKKPILTCITSSCWVHERLQRIAPIFIEQLLLFFLIQLYLFVISINNTKTILFLFKTPSQLGIKNNEGKLLNYNITS